MANKRGWWRLDSGDTDIELSEHDLEYIADCIRQGYVQGEICKDEHDEDTEETANA